MLRNYIRIPNNYVVNSYNSSHKKLIEIQRLDGEQNLM